MAVFGELTHRSRSSKVTRSSLGVEEKASHLEKASRIYAFIKPIRNGPRSFSFMVIFGGFNLHSKTA